MIIPIHIRYANIACPRCGAEVTQPCRADTGYNYDFRYTHSIRRYLWWWDERQRGWREQQRGKENPK